MEPKFLYFQTYGCSANQNNTEIMKGLVRQAGLEITNNPDIADLLVINTCIVKEPTEKKIETRILNLRKYKKPIIIAGCMPEVRKFPGAYLLGIHHVKDIVKLIRKIYEKDYHEEEFLSGREEEKLLTSKIPEIKTIGITQISEGCLGNCSFCITKLAKGSLFSYSKARILENIQSDLDSGAKEIWITSQDNASYGLPEKRKLPELLKEILNLPGKFRVRLGMMNPENVLPVLQDLIEIYKNKKLYKFLHLPLQSGSNKILKLMNRKYKVEDFLKIVQAFKKEIPDLTLSTDIIVGFPEETEADFQESLKIIKEIKPDVLNLSKFWTRRGTKAEKMPQIDKKIAKARASRLMQEFKKLGGNKKWLGKETEVLVYDKFKNFYLARNNSYKLVLIESKNNILGKLVETKITGIQGNHLLGKMT